MIGLYIDCSTKPPTFLFHQSSVNNQIRVLRGVHRPKKIAQASCLHRQSCPARLPHLPFAAFATTLFGCRHFSISLFYTRNKLASKVSPLMVISSCLRTSNFGTGVGYFMHLTCRPRKGQARTTTSSRNTWWWQDTMMCKARSTIFRIERNPECVPRSCTLVLYRPRSTT